jgi:hypothetical protein
MDRAPNVNLALVGADAVRAPASPAQPSGGRFGRGAEPPSEEKSYRDVKHYKRRKRWLS